MQARRGMSQGRARVPGSYERALRAGVEDTDWQELFADNASDVLFQIDRAGHVIWIARNVEGVLGVSAGDLVGADLLEFVHPDDRDLIRDKRAILMAGSPIDVTAMRVRRASGAYQTFAVHARPLFEATGEVNGAFIVWRDVAEQVAMMRAFTTLVEGNRAMMRTTSEQDLITRMCDVVIHVGHYAFAWYGTPQDDAEQTVTIAARAGEHHGYLDTLHVSWGDNDLGRGPTGLALRTGETQVRNDMAADPHFAPWRAQAEHVGIHCSISLPVHVEGRIHGALMVYAAEVGSFDDRAQELLESLAADLGQALERLRAAEALALSEARFRMLAENAMDLVAELHTDDTIAWVSPSVSTVLGFTSEDLIGRSVRDLFVPGTLQGPSSRESRLEEDRTVRARVRTRDGAGRWMEVTLRRLADAGGHIIGRVASARDIEQQVAAEAALEHELDFDSLTGLAKQHLTLARIQEILESRRVGDWALLCVGVDGMTAINQAYTYAAGDEVLREVATRLVQAAGAHDRVGRIAGDEFVVLLRDVVTPADAAEAAERILGAARGPVQWDDARLEVTVSVGIAMRDGSDASALLRDATAAMRNASRQGRDRWGFLDENVAASSRRVLEVQSALRDALRRGAVQPWFMPVHDLATGQLVGYEALARWIAPDGTVTTPDEFLRIAERSSLVVELDRKVLQQSLAVLRRIDPSLHITVNLSAATMRVVEVDAFVRSELTAAGVDPHRLHLEVTETELFDANDRTLHQMRSLARSGIAWWVDDFGTGYSSISHLRDLPIAGVKLDRSFTALVTDPSGRQASLTQGLAGLATGLGLDTIAEGVETEEQASILQAQGWRLGQGWHFGRPAPIDGTVGGPR